MATERSEFEFCHKDAGQNENMAEMLFPRRRFCFCIPCLGDNRSTASVGLTWWQRMRTAAEGGGDRRWYSRGFSALMKIREWSEIVAGPKWKTFIRRFNRNRSGGGNKSGKFQYDPLSYALNFDDGVVHIGGDLDEEYRNFSSRYAVIPASAKSSMDLGKDAPVFT